MKKWVGRIILALAVGLIIFIALNWTIVRQIARFSPIIITPPWLRSNDPAQARLNDIEYMGRFLRYDRSFNEEERAEFEQLIEASKADAATMTDAELFMLAGEATALADNGHTYVNLWPLRREFNSVGVRYFSFSDGLYVVRARGDHADLIGMRITALDGEPIDAVLDALETYSGGMDHWRLFTSLLLLESPELLHAAGIAESADGYTLTVAGPDGEEQDVALDAYATDLDQDSPSFSKPWRNLDAQPLPDEGADWTYTLADLAASDVPLYLQDSDTYYVWAALEDGGGYMRFDESSNSRTQRMAEFFEQNVAALPDGSLEYVVVDLRPNWGGNSNLFVEPAQWLPDKVAEGGHVYVVVGPHTFSAGYNAAALFDYYGGEQSVLVGAPMGIRPQYWGDYGMDFNLPNTGWQLAYATAYHDWENGCDEHPYCHPQTVIHGVAAGDLTPDPIIEPTYDDYAAGRDVVMEWISEQETP